jgi:glycosyltransferase involved in cell wall biosynthesis
VILKDKYIFVLGTAKFDGPFESTSFTLTKLMARDNYVFYIDYPFTWKDYFTLRSTEGYARRSKYFSYFSDGVMPTDNDNLKIVITPPVASINFLPEGRLYRWLLKLNEGLIIRRIKKIIKKYNIQECIYINSFNFHYPNIAEGFNPKLTVYHCVDPLIIDHDKKHGIVSEKELLRNSDLVICTSKQLYDEKKEMNPHTYFVANAADITQSKKALDVSLPVHESLRRIKKPIIGYLGTVERRMDYDLLIEIMKENPDKSFVFAGPLSHEFIPTEFLQQPNVYFPGRIPYNEMPAMLKGFDVALIPFKKDDVSKTIFPLKLFEYLGAGKPVVATYFNPDLKEFTKDGVQYCDDVKSFSEAINNSLLYDSEQDKMNRIDIAENNTWEKRYMEISELLNKYLTNNKPNE